jgi:DNA polymerase-3 subunit delta'
MQTLIHSLTRSQVDAISRARSGSYIFHGAAGMGKAKLAYELARTLNCQGDTPAVCARCRQFEAGAYPDLITVRPEDKPSILIEQVRGLVQALSLSLYYRDGLRVVIIDEAHALTTEAQNALLKLIEEPPPDTLFILVTDQVESLLPTVRSRCVAIYFPRLAEHELVELLTKQHAMKPSDATPLAAAALGIPGDAVMLATDSTAAASRLELAETAKALPGESLFARLLTAKRLTDSKADLPRLARLLHDRLLADVPASAGALQAVELFRRQLAAKVAPRVALERLMLEL